MTFWEGSWSKFDGICDFRWKIDRREQCPDFKHRRPWERIFKAQQAGEKSQYSIRRIPTHFPTIELLCCREKDENSIFMSISHTVFIATKFSTLIEHLEVKDWWNFDGGGEKNYFQIEFLCFLLVFVVLLVEFYRQCLWRLSFWTYLRLDIEEIWQV